MSSRSDIELNGQQMFKAHLSLYEPISLQIVGYEIDSIIHTIQKLFWQPFDSIYIYMMFTNEAIMLFYCLFHVPSGFRE